MRDATQLTKAEKKYIRKRYEAGDAPDNISRDFDISPTDVSDLCYDIQLEPEAQSLQKRSVANVQLAIQDTKLESIGFSKKYMRRLNTLQKEVFDKLGPILGVGIDRFVESVQSGEKVLTIQDITMLLSILTKIGSPDMQFLNLCLKAKELELNSKAVKDSSSRQSVLSGPIRVVPSRTEDDTE